MLQVGATSRGKRRHGCALRKRGSAESVNVVGSSNGGRYLLIERMTVAEPGGMGQAKAALVPKRSRSAPLKEATTARGLRGRRRGRAGKRCCVVRSPLVFRPMAADRRPEEANTPTVSSLRSKLFRASPPSRVSNTALASPRSRTAVGDEPSSSTPHHASRCRAHVQRAVHPSRMARMC